MRASDDTYISRATGRREPPAVCRTCGELVPDTPRFGNEATCDDCARNPPPFRFVSDGRVQICAWHPGHDKAHPANRGASHGICPSCTERLDGGL